MRFFFKSKRFKMICATVAVLLLLSVILRLIGGTIAPHASVLGAIAQPFRTAATYISDEISDFSKKLNDGEELITENEKLHKRIDELTSQVVEYDAAKKENEFLKDFLELKEDNPDFQFEQATLISRESGVSGSGFTINKGSINGISARDPVITSSGLVGYISEVGPSYAKVETILSDNIKIGSIDFRTSDVGIVSGDPKLSKDGNCKFFNLPRSCSVAMNDIIVTSGGGIFPKGLVVGTITSLTSDENSTTITAILDTAVNISEIRDVMVITYFDGQGSISKAD